MSRNPKRDLDVVRAYEAGSTLREVGEEFSLSYERVRQIVGDRIRSSGSRSPKVEPEGPVPGARRAAVVELSRRWQERRG